MKKGILHMSCHKIYRVGVSLKSSRILLEYPTILILTLMLISNPNPNPNLNSNPDP